jgi:hypothetical protein
MVVEREPDARNIIARMVIRDEGHRVRKSI